MAGLNPRLTDRERILILEARNRELEDELREYRRQEREAVKAPPRVADDKLNHFRRRLFTAFPPSGGACPTVILLAMLGAAPRALHRDNLFDMTRPYGVASPDGDLKTIDVQMVHLRKALANLGFPGVIKTLRCVGYYIEAPDALRIEAALAV